MIKQEECTGCGACKSICPQNAIIMKPNIGGFLYPEIDYDKCIHCNLCSEVCNDCNNAEYNIPSKVIALKHFDNAVRENSTSGGAFHAIAEIFINNKGIVYGASFDDDWNVYHIRCTNLTDVRKLQKSKYVQSNLNTIFEQVVTDLKNEKEILFSGTACQCSGLLTLVKSRKLNAKLLFTCDLICHGVPSPEIWRDYIKYRSKKEKSQIKEIDFRYKKKSWRDFRIYLSFNDGKKLTYRQNEDYFLLLFFHNYILRSSCYNCKYSSIERVSDLTLGDFWGVEEFYPKFSDDKGVSVVLANTPKGQHLIKIVEEKNECLVVTIDEITKRQPNLIRPTNKNNKYQEFWEDYVNMGFDQIIKKYADATILGRIKRKYLFKFLYKTGIFNILLKIKRH